MQTFVFFMNIRDRRPEPSQKKNFVASLSVMPGVKIAEELTPACLFNTCPCIKIVKGLNPACLIDEGLNPACLIDEGLNPACLIDEGLNPACLFITCPCLKIDSA